MDENIKNENSALNRLSVDFDHASEDLNLILDELLFFKFDNKIRKAMGVEYTEKLNKWKSNIEKRIKDDFSIVVIGDFKRGKSTFINALLGEKIVSTNVTPETVTINRVSYNDMFHSELVFKDGRKIELTYDELKREHLENIIAETSSPVECIDIKVPNEMLKGIRIVDTPGIGDLLNQFDDQIKDYLVHADAIIYIVSALTPLSESEKTFLCASILPQNFYKLFVVVNMMDCLESEDEVFKIKNLIENRVSDIFPNAQIYGVSGLDEYCRIKGLKRPNSEISDMLAKSFDQMRLDLKEDIIVQKDIIQIQRASNMLNYLINELSSKVQFISSLLELNKQKLDDLSDAFMNDNSELLKRVAQHKQTIKLEVKEMSIEAKEWMTLFLSRMYSEIKNSESISIETLEKYFHFYMIDSVRGAIMECTNAHMKKIAVLIENVTEAMANEINVSVSVSKSISSSIVDVSWTNYDSAIVPLNFIPGFEMLAVLGQSILGFVKQANTQGQQKKYISAILDGYDQLKDMVLVEMDKVYGQIMRFSSEELDKIYKKQIETSLEAIQQAQDIALTEESDKKEIIDGLASANEIINLTKSKVEAFEKRFEL
ncbi:MAG: hypothetical protein CVV02_02195 [Firmicutes bacterium HGW-Firmicutes-7]|nr:MAG: hypothetical protein CVV02_02195 [Firmicutes bacterium HGW-Firmicutes-7]